MSNILLDVLSSALFSGVPSNAVYDVLKASFGRLKQQKPLDEMYLDAFVSAVEEAKPQLSVYVHDGVIELDREQLRRALHADFGSDLGATSLSKLSESDAINRIASAMASRSVLSIGGNTLSVADYEQVLRNLVRHAASNFTAAVLADEISFRAVILSEANENLKLLADVRSYLAGRFGITLEQFERKLDYQTDLLEQLAQVGANSPFIPSEKFFRHYLDPKRLFTHRWDLVGREAAVTDLDAHVMRDETRAVILPGRGGIGKTKVLYAFAERFAIEHPGSAIRFVRDGVEIAGTAASLPQQPCVIVVDDAHRRHDLRILFEIARDHRFPVTLVLATRPHATDYLRSLLRNAGFDTRDVIQLPALDKLSREDVKALARQALGAAYAEHVDRLAHLTLDSPLVTVVGGRLLAEKGIDPLLLERDADFQSAVLLGFRDVLLGEIGDQSESELFKKLLPLIAAVTPLFPTDERLQHAAAEYLGIDQPALMIALGMLEATGVLLRVGSGLRLVPDVLADHILHKECLTDSGLPTGYAQRIYKRFAAICPAQVLTNLAELDWRVVTATGKESTLLNEVWQSMEEEFLHATHAMRCHMLRNLEDVAYYQPARVLHLIELAFQHPSAEETESDSSSYDGYSHQDVLQRLPSLLQQVGYSLEHLPQCCNLLWQLGRDDPRPTNSTSDHPMRVLAELGRYDRSKPLSYNSVVLRAAERWAATRDPGRYRHSPLDALDPMLAKTGTSSHREGRSVTISSYPISPANTQALRRGALRVIVADAVSTDLATSLRAVASLEEALHGPFPFGAGKVPAEEIRGWIPDQLYALEQIAYVVAHSSHPLVHLEIRRILAWHARNGASEEIKGKAMSIVSAIPNSFEFRLVRMLINALHGWMLEDAEEVDEALRLAQARREDDVRRVAREFLDRYPDPREGADILDERMRWSAYLDKQIRLDPSQLLSEVCRQLPEYGGKLCRIVLAEPDRPVSKCFHSLLHVMREVDPSQAASVIREALATDNVDTLETIAFMYRFCDGFSPEDIDNITRLLATSNPSVKVQALGGLRRLGHDQAEAAIALARTVEIGSRTELAEALFGIFDSRHGVAPALLDEEVVGVLLAKLEPVDAIDGIEVGGFLAHASERWPHAVVRTLIRRLSHDHSQQDGYEPFPYQGLQSGLAGLASSNCYDDLLTEIRDAALHPRTTEIHSPLSKLFWQASQGQINRALASLNDWIDTQDEDKLRGLGELLRACPRSLIFEHQDFVAHLLKVALLVNQSCHDFVAAVLHQPRFGDVYSLDDPDEYQELQRKASEAAAGWADSEPAHSFYKQMAEEAARTSQHHRDLFAALDDE